MFDEVRELPEVAEYLINRNLIDQYGAAKRKLFSANTKWLDFKLRQPKKLQVYQFRINKKYRGFGTIALHNGKKVFIVHTISDHQDF